MTKSVRITAFASVALAATIVLAGRPALAHDGHDDSLPHASQPDQLALTLNAAPLVVGKPVDVQLQIKDNMGHALAMDEFSIAHTKRIHLLVVDPSLTDYHHLHPEETAENGVFKVTFTPQKTGPYRVFADVVPTATGRQQYVITDLKAADTTAGAIDKTESYQTTVDGYQVVLTLEGTLTVNQPTIAHIKIADSDGKPVDYLQPVMGAYSHLVGFTEDRLGIMHVHPMGQEPASDTEHGGPEMMYHIQPTTPGFVKLFAQFRIKDRDVFAPFGVVVAAAAAGDQTPPAPASEHSGHQHAAPDHKD